MGKKGLYLIVNSVAMHEEPLMQKSLLRSFLTVNATIDQLEHELNLCRELFRPHVKLLIAQIAIEITEFCQQNFGER